MPLFQISLDDRKQFAPVTRQRDMARRPVKQPETELPLQLTNQNTQARRGDEQSFGRAGETSMLSDEQEATELTRREIYH